MSLTKIITLILFEIILSFYSQCFSQNVYRTSNGYVLISGVYEDSAFFADSHKLEIDYNPVNKSIYSNINLQTFTSGILFIDSILAEKPRYLALNGFIPVDFLTWAHKEYNLDVSLEIKFNNIKVISPSKMRFKHIDKLMGYTCVMEASFVLKLSDFINNLPEKIDSYINIQFLQLILRRESK